jgi:hypothetical protein
VHPEPTDPDRRETERLQVVVRSGQAPGALERFACPLQVTPAAQRFQPTTETPSDLGGLAFVE